jgi:hypothetical protein
MITILIWLNRTPKPEIKMFGFFQCIHEIKTDTCYNKNSSLMEVFEWKI